jgi:RNA polymerase sigma factor (sigma-70 family)
MQDPSAELLKKVQSNDRRAQLELYQLCYPVLIGVARRFRKNEEEHKTLVNNAFMKIIQNIEKYQDIRFFSWIKRIITNEIIDDFRRSKNYHAFYQHDATIQLAWFSTYLWWMDIRIAKLASYWEYPNKHRNGIRKWHEKN